MYENIEKSNSIKEVRKKFQEPHRNPGQYQKPSSEQHNLFGRGNKLPATNNRKRMKIISQSLVGKWFLCTAVQIYFFKINISVFELTDEDTPVPKQVNWIKTLCCTDSQLFIYSPKHVNNVKSSRLKIPLNRCCWWGQLYLMDVRIVL